MITTKNVKETEKELPHTEIYIDSVYVGYITRNTSKFAQVGENWNFTSKTDKIPCMFDKTKQGLINNIKNHLN